VPTCPAAAACYFYNFFLVKGLQAIKGAEQTAGSVNKNTSTAAKDSGIKRQYSQESTDFENSGVCYIAVSRNRGTV
jgi:hypothetical protein